jgi:hypothetical protein
VTKTFTTEAEIDVSLSDFDTEDLIDEIKERYLTRIELEDLKKYVLKGLNEVEKRIGIENFKIETLCDQLKVEAFIEAMNNNTLPEIIKRLA